MKRELNYNLSDKEVYYTACSLLVILKNSCSQLHSQRGSSLFMKTSYRHRRLSPTQRRASPSPRSSSRCDPTPYNLFERSHQTVTSKVTTGASNSLYYARPPTVAFVLKCLRPSRRARPSLWSRSRCAGYRGAGSRGEGEVWRAEGLYGEGGLEATKS